MSSTTSQTLHLGAARESHSDTDNRRAAATLCPPPLPLPPRAASAKWIPVREWSASRTAQPAKDAPRQAALCAKNDCSGHFVIRSEWGERNPTSNRLRNRENQQINMMGTVKEGAAPSQG